MHWVFHSLERGLAQPDKSMYRCYRLLLRGAAALAMSTKGSARTTGIEAEQSNCRIQIFSWLLVAIGSRLYPPANYLNSDIGATLFTKGLF